MNFSQLFQETVQRLENSGIDDAEVEACQIFDFCFGLDRTRLFLHGERKVPEENLAEFQEVLQRRSAREPLQYITGIREFWSMDFHVSPAVLVPRPETEFLLEHTISICGKDDHSPKSILDMCTGSGVIAVVLTKELNPAKIIAVDRSISALQIAVKNSAEHGMTDQIQFVCSDLFSAFRELVLFDIIVSNPPYIGEKDVDSLQPEVRKWEPHTALLAGKEGLDIIVQLADTAHNYLNPGGWLFVEIGADQKGKVEQLFSDHASGVYEEVKVVSDWSGRPRVLQAQKSGRSA